jgi:dihydrofolate reductase
MASLDGYTVDASGSFDWAAPDEEVHAYVNDRMRDVGTYLYGRGMWETMRFWADPSLAEQGAAVSRDFAAIWQAADKIVYSGTLGAVEGDHTSLEPSFDPAAVRELVGRADRDVEIGGPGLAAHALRAGLVDEIEFLAVPVLIGGGTHWLPQGLRLDLELVDEHRFAGGSVDLRYRVRR